METKSHVNNNEFNSNFKFLKLIHNKDVVNLNWFAPLGALMYIITMLFYVLTCVYLENTRARDMMIIVNIVHLLVGILVYFDTKNYAGSSVLLQTFIIGLGSFNTFVITSTLGYSVNSDESYEAFGFNFTSVLFACLSNGMMLALLFAIFHKN